MEFFGGTVNVKWLSVLFVGDDAIDTDEGYQGKLQFVYIMLGAKGDTGCEMDSKTGGNLDSMPRSHPELASVTIIGGGGTASNGALMRLREGTGGKFANLVLAHGRERAVRIDQCGSVALTQAVPSVSAPLAGSGADAPSALDRSSYLFFSSKNVVAPLHAAHADGAIRNDCDSTSLLANQTDADFAGA